MRALQYIYTLCKMGSDGKVGYACYSKSDGLKESECEEIQKYTTYFYCKDLPAEGSKDELQVHPKNFCSFTLSNGKICIALSVYLGQYFDTKVEARCGNYISHALIIEKTELCQYPAALYGAACFKSCLTPDELSLPYPYPKLPCIDVPYMKGMVDISRVITFMESRGAKFSLLMSLFLKAKEDGKLLYISDTQENIILWIAALQMALPVYMCTEVSFATYKYYDKAIFHNTVKKLPYTVIGLRDKAMVRFADGSMHQAGGTFDYQSEIYNGGHIIFDEINGLYTQGIEISPFAEAVSEYYQSDVEALYEFHAFLNKTDIAGADRNVEEAFAFYELATTGRYTDEPLRLAGLLEFGAEHVKEEEVHGALAEELTDLLRGNIDKFSGKSLGTVIKYISRYASYLIYTVYEILGRTMEQSYADSLAQSFEKQIHELHMSVSDIMDDFWFWYLSDENLNDMIRRLADAGDDGRTLHCLSFLASNRKAWEHAVYRFILAAMVFMHNKKMLTDFMYGCIRNQGESEQKKFMHELTADSKTLALALEIQRMGLHQSGKAEEYFWAVYQEYYVGYQDIDLGGIIQDFLDIDGSLRQVRQIVEKIDANTYSRYETLKKMAACVEKYPLGEIMDTLGMGAVIRLVQMIMAVERANRYPSICMDKLMALYFGVGVKRGVETGKLRHISNIDVKGRQLCISSLPEKDYKKYMSMYLPYFCAAIRTKEDLSHFMNCTYSQHHSEAFFHMLLNQYKKKDEAKKRAETLAMLCAVMIDDEEKNEAYHALSRQVISYMARQSQSEQEIIMEQARALCVGNSEKFFTQLQESSNRIGRLKSLFHRK